MYLKIQIFVLKRRMEFLYLAPSDLEANELN